MCCNKNKCIITAEVLTSSGTINLPMSINARIGNNVITSIWMPRSGSNTLKTQTGKTVATDIVMATGHLWLKDANGQEVVTIPLWMIMRDFNSPEALTGEWIGIDVSQSYITLDATAINTAHAIQISFGYDCQTKCK